MRGMLRSVSGSLRSLFVGGGWKDDMLSVLSVDEMRLALTSMPQLQLLSAPGLLLPKAAIDIVGLAESRHIHLDIAGIDLYEYDQEGCIVFD